MAKKDYDKTLFRLLSILTKLSNNECPTTKELAEEFNVSIRTIQKDIAERLCNFPITKDKQKRLIFFDGFSIRRTVLDEDELMFLNLALSQFDDVDDIDKIQQRIFQKLVHVQFSNPYFIKQDDIEDIDVDSPKIELLERLIKEHAVAILEFQETKKYVELYKITNYDGFWYIFGKDQSDNKIKTFLLSSVNKIISTDKYHSLSDNEINLLLNKTHSAFFADGSNFEVVVKVYPEIAHYFEKKEFLETQKIIQKYTDGSLEVSFQVSHDEDVDNIIKSWLPHIEVVKPERFRRKVINELKTYLQKIDYRTN
ncbi:WYL domain-containing protein [Sulfurimonas sp. SWIR-19]|uniref:helix-turn-helix transcriptional regulator n=1 Tax=Sulfurimonas sp. SWIR-19 TaxID=2878390 RepID=UPI001CF58D9A|nr:WYL domain-containing protein [Sulfurimonas sp. SWIR-19]UCN01248.1 WYL domain-containing protein [Sulfurimonas sp. SWIR-19]